MLGPFWRLWSAYVSAGEVLSISLVHRHNASIYNEIITLPLNISMTQESTLQKQIQEAEAIVKELRKKLDEERKGERMQAIASAKELIKNHELTAADLGFSGKGSSVKRPAGDKRGVVAAKYQDHESGKTWTGRGKSPAWLAAQLAAGYSKDDYLIKS